MKIKKKMLLKKINALEVLIAELKDSINVLNNDLNKIMIHDTDTDDGK